MLSGVTLLAVAPAGTGTADVRVATIVGTSSQNPGDRYTYAPAATGYAYNGDGLRMSEAMPGGTKQFAWDITPSVPEPISDGNMYYIYGPGGLPIEQIDNSGNTSYFFHDAIGSTRALLAGNGSVGATFTYTPYGALKASTGTLTTPLLFAQSYSDNASGLLYLVNRYYNPTTAQFLTVDPAFTQTRSSYGYADGDPANVIDPLGMFSFNACFGICVGYDSERNGWGGGFGLGAGLEVGPVASGTEWGTATIAYPHTGQLSWSAGWGGLSGQIDAQPGRVTGGQLCGDLRWSLSLCAGPDAGGNWSSGGGGAYPDPYHHPSPLPLFDPHLNINRMTTSSAYLGPSCGPRSILA